MGVGAEGRVDGLRILVAQRFTSPECMHAPQPLALRTCLRYCLPTFRTPYLAQCLRPLT